MTQGILPFQYQEDSTKTDLTVFAGLMLYLDLFVAGQLRQSVEKHLGFLDGEQGWTAYELLTSLALLNLAGGDSVNDIDVLEGDTGFATVFRQFRMHGQGRKARREVKARWRKQEQRALPSRSAVFRFLDELRLRTDTAGYEIELLRYCAEGKSERFGVIPFAIGCDVTEAFKHAVGEVEDNDWRPLIGNDGKPTKQQWAEVCFVPNWVAAKKNGPTYRFIAIRELLMQDSLPGIEEQPQLPFPTMQFLTGTYKLFGVVTNQLEMASDDLIRWHRLRCGKSEEIHAVMKDDLAGGRLPSGKFGANAAWWGIMVMSLNLHAVFKQLGLGETWVRKRMKAIRFALLNVAGRVIHHSRQVVVRLSAGGVYDLILAVRQRLLALVHIPAG